MTAMSLRYWISMSKIHPTGLQQLAKRTAASCVLMILSSSFCYGSDDFFEQLDVEIIDELDKDANHEFSGWAKQIFAYGYQDPGNLFSRKNSGLTSVASSLQLRFDGALSERVNYRIASRFIHESVYRLNDDYLATAAEIDDLENRIDIKDVYLDIDISSGLYLRLGNQIVAWGEAETINITDLVAIRDQLILGQADLEDLRLQVPAAKLSYLMQGSSLEFVATYEAGLDRFAPAGHEFDPFIRLRNEQVELIELDAANKVEYFLRYSQFINNGQYSVVIADVNANDLSGIAALQSAGKVRLTYQADRFQMLGFSANYAHRLMVLKTEVGLHFNRTLAPKHNDILGDNIWQESDQLLAMLGLDYGGFGDAEVSVELNYIHTPNNVQNLAVSRHQWGANSRLFWQDTNELLTLQLDWTHLLNDDGDITRLTANYELAQSWTLGALLVVYSAKNPTAGLYDYRHNDVFQLSVKYSF
ncbi:conserved hypothetical protein [Shewanella violacea DSS12]|uniref:DUF1302 domain-containing protein n=2 Tax=Shewanella violacea TaxID=60217 RepID=D4ZDP5_SHEVD|nr:conserved hypothetical protein [Shewanella violacea DSS12]